MKKTITRTLLSVISILLILMLTSCDLSSLPIEVDGKDGLSAYELAVQNGFEGTLEEWLASLKGEPGKNGLNGKTGEKGDDGRDGLDAPGSLDGQLGSSFVVVTEYLEPNTGKDLSVAIQNIIDSNPNRVIYFPDGEYLVKNPIKTSAKYDNSVSLMLSSYAEIKAMSGWSGGSTDAIIMLGAKESYNDINQAGSNYFLKGGIINGNGIANGVSIDSGRETLVEGVSIKNATVGLHIKRGVNNGSSDADIMNVNIVGSGTYNSIGVLIQGWDNTLTNMRIANVQKGVKLETSSNFLRNIHPLYLDNGYYSSSIGFEDTFSGTSGNFYDMCYSDQFATGFQMLENSKHVYNNCFCYWYAASGAQTGFKVKYNEKFNGIIRSSKVTFHNDSTPANNAYLSASTEGNGVVENPLFDVTRSGNNAYLPYLSGRVIW